jgi:hypothetical protein
MSELLSRCEREIFNYLKTHDVPITEERMRYPVSRSGEYIGPDYDTRERLKHESDDSCWGEETANLVRAWVYFCTELWCSDAARIKYRSFGDYTRSLAFSNKMGKLALRPGYRELINAPSRSV